MKIVSSVIPFLAASFAQAGIVKTFDSSKAKAASNFADFEFKNRLYVPYNLDGEFGYGMGTLEQIAFDHAEGYIYGVSERGFIQVIDAKTLTLVGELGVNVSDKLTDIELCPRQGKFFVAANRGTDNGIVYELNTVSRVSPMKPSITNQFEVGSVPDMLIANPDCTVLVTANEGEGEYDDVTGLMDPIGGVSIIRLGANGFNSKTLNFDQYSDSELISKGLHLPLSENAMKYWSKYHGLNFNNALASYNAGMNLEPEYLAWSPDYKTVYVNLQENNGLIMVDVESETISGIASYGLKDFSSIGIDVVKDDDCNLVNPNVHGIRMPDAITSVEVDGVAYVLTANEGDDKEYGDFEEKQKSKDIFDGGSLGLTNFTASSDIFNPTDVTAGFSAPFNGECDESNAATPFCQKSLRITVGSSGVDYTNIDAPELKNLVVLGGRGISIYKADSNGLDLTWDSGSEFEQKGCEAFPWSHNSIQDEEFSPINGTLWKTDDDIRETLLELNDPDIDGCVDQGDGTPGACPLSKTVDERSAKDGPGAEAIVVGEACGRLMTVTVAEKNSIGFAYDITEPSSPILVKTFHLTPGSESLSAGLAYGSRVIGEVDAESIVFVEEAHSPTGKAGVFFAGAWSGTVSWWEFTCADDPASAAFKMFTSSTVTLLGSIVTVWTVSLLL